MQKLLVFLITFCFSVPILAQKTKHVSAEETYISDNKDESIKQAEEKTFLRARIKALTEEFGAKVSNQTDIITTSENGETSVRFRQRGGTEIKAEWLKTIKQEVRSRSISDDGFMIITVYVEGIAREITLAGVDFEYHLLRNSDKLESEDDRFRNNDHLYLMFKSPVDGFLAVYMTDDEKAYCLLPYIEQTDGIYQVKANRQYIFFSQKYAQPEEANYNLRRRLISDKAHEVNTVYVIFSQKPFTKKTDNDGIKIQDNLYFARNVDLDDFEDWLYKCQKQDVGMKVEKKEITISKK